MTGERWVPPGERTRADPRRRVWLDEYLGLGIHRAQWPSGASVTFGEFAELREAGRWNEVCDEKLRGKFKINGEG